MRASGSKVFPRLIIIVATAAVAILLTAAGYLGLTSSRPAENTPPPTPVMVAVSRGDVQQTVLAPGQLVGTKEVVLSLAANGQVAEVSVRPGSVVKTGDVLARLANGATTVAAPFDGVVLDVMIRQGESALAGQSLMLLADPKALEVQATVIEEDLPLVAVGQRAELFFDAQPELATPGHVSRVVPQRVPHEDRPLYHVYITLDEPVEGVVAGMTADAAIIIAEAKDVLRLPRAIVRAGSGDMAQVQVWANSQISERTVRLGLRSNIYVEIQAGLREGEEVIGQ